MGALKVTIEGDFEDVAVFLTREERIKAKNPDSEASKEKIFEDFIGKIRTVIVTDDSGVPGWEYK